MDKMLLVCDDDSLPAFQSTMRAALFNP